MERKFLALSIVWHRWVHWEFWPAWLANIPVVFFWLWFSLRARDLLFFTAVNPAIETGGVLGESKYRILQKFEKRHLPNTLFIPAGMEVNEAVWLLEQSGMGYPLVVKPDIGERGRGVRIVLSEADLRVYLSAFSVDVLLQEFIDYPEEVSVLYHRFPGAERGKITSLCLKRCLSVCGDGQHSVAFLMQKDRRAALQLPRFRKEKPELLREIPAKGEELVLEVIGNHCKGTAFLNGNAFIDGRLERVFDRITEGVEGIYYGRFDLKCKSLEHLKRGEELAILEFNGIAGEPAHVYDPSMPVWKVYRDFYRHWKIIYRLYKAQRKRGVRSASWAEVLEVVMRYRTVVKKMST